MPGRSMAGSPGLRTGRPKRRSPSTVIRTLPQEWPTGSPSRRRLTGSIVQAWFGGDFLETSHPPGPDLCPVPGTGPLLTRQALCDGNGEPDGLRDALVQP